MRRFAFALIAAAALAACAGSAIARSPTFDSKVTIDYGDISKSKALAREFRGKVTSSKHDCEVGREVKVFHVDPGADTLVGLDETNAHGKWALGNDIAKGRHYAKVRKAAIGSGFCKAARSQKITVHQA